MIPEPHFAFRVRIKGVAVEKSSAIVPVHISEHSGSNVLGRSSVNLPIVRNHKKDKS